MEESQVRPVFGGGRGRCQGRGRGKLMFTKQSESSSTSSSSGSETGTTAQHQHLSGLSVPAYAAFYEESRTNENEASMCNYSRSESQLETRNENKGMLSDNNTVDGTSSSSFGDTDSTCSEQELTSFQLPPVLDGEQGTRGPQLSKSRVELAHEFRMDAVLSASPIPAFYRCCVCGCPAGYNTYSCKINSHPTCYLCTTELNISECPYLRKSSEGKIKVCKSQLYQFPSMFRAFVFDQTQVSCINYSKGCQAVGIWEDIKEHQEECKFTDK